MSIKKSYKKRENIIKKKNQEQNNNTIHTYKIKTKMYIYKKKINYYSYCLNLCFIFILFLICLQSV